MLQKVFVLSEDDARHTCGRKFFEFVQTISKNKVFVHNSLSFNNFMTGKFVHTSKAKMG